MTDLRAMSWPERLKWALENDLGTAELAQDLGMPKSAVSAAKKRHGIKLRDKRAERMRRLNADPEFAAAHAERMRRLHADGRMVKHHLAGMTPEQRADYDTLKRSGYTKAKALAALGLGGGA